MEKYTNCLMFFLIPLISLSFIRAMEKPPRSKHRMEEEKDHSKRTRTNAGDQTSMPFIEACRSDPLQAINDLIRGGADVNGADARGNTPLMAAAARAVPEIMLLLLSRGARVDAFTRNPADHDHTPLLAALNQRDNNNVLSLLWYGAPLRCEKEINAIKQMFEKTGCLINHVLFEPQKLAADFKEFVKSDADLEEAFLVAIGQRKLSAVSVLFDQSRSRGLQAYFIALARKHIDLLLKLSHLLDYDWDFYNKFRNLLNAMLERANRKSITDERILNQVRRLLGDILDATSHELAAHYHVIGVLLTACLQNQRDSGSVIVEILRLVRIQLSHQESLKEQDRDFLVRLEAILLQSKVAQIDTDDEVGNLVGALEREMKALSLAKPAACDQ